MNSDSTKSGIPNRICLSLILVFLFCVYESNGFQEVSIKVLQNKAESIGKSNVDSVLLLLEQIEERSEKSQLPKILCENDWIRAKTYYGLKDYSKAREFAISCVERANPINANDVLAKAHNLLGVLARRVPDFNLASKHYKLSLKNRELISDSLGVSKTLQNLGNLFRSQGLVDSAFLYYQRSLAIKLELRDTASLNKTISNLANYYFQVGDNLKAVELYKEVLSFRKRAGFKEGIARLYNNIGSAYRQLGYYRIALNNYMDGLALYDSLGMKPQAANTLLNIATVFKGQSDYSESLLYTQRALDIYLELGESSGESTAYRNMADIFLVQNRPSEALDLLEKSERIYMAKNMKSDLADIYHGFGRAFSGLGDFNRAKSYFDRSVTIDQELGDFTGLGKTFNSLAVMYYQKREYISAREFYVKSFRLGENYKDPILMRASLLGLSEVNDALGNHQDAYGYRLQYDVIKDSLVGVEKSRQLAEIREIYETEQKDQQISKLQLENRAINAEREVDAAMLAKQRSDKLVFIITAISLFIVAIGVYLYFRQRLSLSKLRVNEEREQHNNAVNQLLLQQQTKSLESLVKGQEQEKHRIAKELHDHFGSLMAAVKVNLSTVVSRTYINPDDEARLQKLASLVDRACEDIRSLSHSMNVGISETFGLVPALKDLCHSVNSPGKLDVTFVHSQCTDKLDLTLEVIAYRIVQELVSNVLKHSNASELSVQLTCLEDLLSIIVEDNGEGFDVSFYTSESKGMGLDNLKARIDSLQGEFEIDSSPQGGTTVVIDLPIVVQENVLVS